MQACERANMMRAVGAEVITQQCAQGCDEDWKLPALEGGADLGARVGQRVRLRGVMDKDGAVKLADGGRVRLASGPAVSAGVQVEAGVAVIVAATVGAGSGEYAAELKMVTVVAAVVAGIGGK